jgi:hypothetical protein
MKVYEAIYKEGENEGVYALSVVENPAMEDMWIALAEHPQKIELAQVNEEKRLLLGAALIPNKRIYRNIDGNEFEMFFTAETIEKLAHSFMRNQNNNNSSLEHELKLEGMSVVEAWTVENPETDKSANYGKTYPKGTWVTMMKVENEDMWSKVKNGEIKGFSIDALLGLEQVQLKTNINNMNEEVKKSIVQEVLDGVKALFSAKEVSDSDTNVELENVEVKSEEVTEVVEEFDKEAFMAEVIETVKTEFSAQADERLEAVKLELSTKIDELTKENETLKIELNKQPEVESVKLNQHDEVKPRVMVGRTIHERVMNAING